MTQRYIACLIALANVATSGPACAATTSGVTAIRHARLQQNAPIARHEVDAIASFWTDDVTICRGLGAQVAGKSNYRKL